jgi:hypothetical protein
LCFSCIFVATAILRTIRLRLVIGAWSKSTYTLHKSSGLRKVENTDCCCPTFLVWRSFMSLEFSDFLMDFALTKVSGRRRLPVRPLSSVRAGSFAESRSFCSGVLVVVKVCRALTTGLLEYLSRGMPLTLNFRGHPKICFPNTSYWRKHSSTGILNRPSMIAIRLLKSQICDRDKALPGLTLQYLFQQ